MRGRIIGSLVLILTGSNLAQGQDSSTPASQPQRRALLSSQPYGSARNDGYAGALSPFADSTDAALSNPAGIGGLSKQPSKRWVRQLHFPLVYGAFNEDSQAMTETVGLQGGLTEVDVQQSVNETLAGRSQYSRVSLFPNVGFGRVMVGPIYDIELASTKPYDDQEIVDLAYQQKTGGGAGFSFADPKGHLFLGVFAHFLNLERLQSTYTADQVADAEDAKQLLDADMETYQGVGINAGAVWLVNHRLNPAISLRVKDAGGTSYSHKSGPGESFKHKEDLGVGFGMSPEIFSNSYAYLSVETSHLTDGDLALERKWHVGSGLTFGGQGALSVFGLNAGINSAGFAYGGHLNIGLIGVQYANFAVDVGVEDEREIERRQSGTVSINLAQ